MFASGATLTLSNIAYERLSLLLNLASLYCRLATNEDRSTVEGIKRAVASFAVSSAN
jgi:programmed cell death 6-interacting protein